MNFIQLYWKASR